MRDPFALTTSPRRLAVFRSTDRPPSSIITSVEVSLEALNSKGLNDSEPARDCISRRKNLDARQSRSGKDWGCSGVGVDRGRGTLVFKVAVPRLPFYAFAVYGFTVLRSGDSTVLRSCPFREGAFFGIQGVPTSCENAREVITLEIPCRPPRPSSKPPNRF
jgi:hypothetical protein